MGVQIYPNRQIGKPDGARGGKCYAVVNSHAACLNAYRAAPNKYSKLCNRSAIHRLDLSAYDKRLLLTEVSATVTKETSASYTSSVGAKCINRVVLFPSRPWYLPERTIKSRKLILQNSRPSSHETK